MSVVHEEKVEVNRNALGESKQVVNEIAPSTRTVLVSRITKLIWILATVVVAIIVARFVMLLIGVNPGAPFADFIYGLSQPLVAPFAGLLQDPVVGTGSFVEVASIVALIVYSLVATLIVWLFRVLFASSRSTKTVRSVERRNI